MPTTMTTDWERRPSVGGLIALAGGAVMAIGVFLPWVTGAELHEKSERDLLASMEMQRAGVSERFTTRNTFERPSMMTLRLVRGPFRLLEGRWGFTPIGDAGTRIELEMRFEFANPVVSLLFGKAFEQSCNSLIDAFIVRARQLHGSA